MPKSATYPRFSGYEKSVPAGLLDFSAQENFQSHSSYDEYPQHSFNHGFTFQAAMPDNVDHDYQYVTQSHLAPAQVFNNNSSPRVSQPPVVPSTNTVASENAAPLVNSRKRKASSDDTTELARPRKKGALAQIQAQAPAQIQVHDACGDYYDLSGQTSPYSPYVPTPTGSTIFPAYPVQEASPKPSGHHYSVSNASAVSIPAHSPNTPAFTPSYVTVKSELSPRVPVTPLSSAASTISSSKNAHPKLVRTSTIQQSPPTVQNHIAAQVHTQSFNPYALYPLKADLKLNGDLDSMISGWSQEEKDNRRRLVEFKRSQHGSVINAEFKPVTQQERIATNLTISCILWKEKNEYYVTSVDTIALLESLIGARFTVEEKNRIRRNLEGFRPLTVSKSKPDSEEFFKVIMGFPNPRPRNIEKDVKVFPWHILAGALKKIIGKYSASYSSTAGTLCIDPSSYSDDPVDCRHQMSPQVPMPMPAQMTYAGMYGPGPAVPRMAIPRVTGPPLPQQQMSAPMHGMPHYYDYSEFYPYQNMPAMSRAPMPMSSVVSASPMSAPVMHMQPQWEHAQYVYEHSARMAPVSAPASAYPRNGIEIADFITPVNYHSKSIAH